MMRLYCELLLNVGCFMRFVQQKGDDYSAVSFSL